MRIVNIEPKDIHVTLDMSLNEIDMVLDALEIAVIEFDGSEDPKLPRAVEFLKTTFWKTLDGVAQEVGQ